MMKKLLLSVVIVFCSFVFVSAQTGKNTNGSKAQNNITAPVQGAKKTSSQIKTEAEQKAEIKKAEALKANAAKSKPNAAMSLVESQK
jgi:hypothetical protein